MSIQEADESRYESWPAEPADRQEIGREVLGQHFVAAYNAWLEQSHRMIFQGHGYKSPTEVQLQYQNWLATLDGPAKEAAFAFVRQMVGGTLFALLTNLDGASGFVLSGEYRERIRISLEIVSESQLYEDIPKPEATIALNPDESVFLHDLWYGWLARYSNWERDTPQK